MAKEITLEQALEENKALKEQLKALIELPSKLEEALLENEVLKSENEELKLVADKGAKIAKIIPGTYTSKKHKVSIRFKDGMVKSSVNGKLVDSAEVIKNKDGKYTQYLDFCIEVGASVIEIVEK